MTQTITTRYQEFNTSSIQNDRFVGVVPAGVYLGYRLSAGSGISNLIDITAGADGVSTLVTPEGVVVTETSNIPGAVRIASADPNFSRIDAVVAEYTYSTDPSRGQIYKVIQGANQLIVGLNPVNPPLQNGFQVLLGYVLVQGGSNSITFGDVQPVPKATSITSGDWSNLQATVDFTDSRIIYVFPGVFPTIEGDKVVDFSGGFSAPIEDTAFVEGTTRFYTFGISDDSQVLAASWASSEASADITGDLLIVAQAEVRKVNGLAQIISLKDVRLPFARTRYRANEDLKYQELLANSVYRFLRVENFDSLAGVDLNSVSGGSLVLDSAEKSLKILGAASVDVEFSSTDLIDGSSIPTIKEFLLVADSTVENLRFDYSVTSSRTGFTGEQFTPGEAIRILAPNASRIYIRFFIPGGEFVGKTSTRIFSYGVLVNLSDESANLLSVTNLGVSELVQSVDNLIHNGDFYYWSKNTLSGKAPDLLSKDALEFPISTEAPQAADGWQFTNINANFDSNSIKRLSQHGSAPGTSMQLAFTVNPNSTDANPTVLEYRVPRGSELSGKKLTFAFEYRSNESPAVSLGIGQFRRTDAGLVLVESEEVLLNAFTGTARISTKSTIAPNVDAVSFYIKFNANVGNFFDIWNARAAVGLFPDLPFAYSTNAATVGRSYHERGQFYLSSFSQAGSVLGSSTQFGSPKHVELGDLIVQTVPSAAADRSKNVNNISYSADRDSVTLSATATTSNVIIQTDWEAYIKYTGSIV